MAIWCVRHPSFESCIHQRKATCLLSIRKALACFRASKLTTANMYVCMYGCMHVCMYVCYIYIYIYIYIYMCVCVCVCVCVWIYIYAFFIHPLFVFVNLYTHMYTTAFVTECIPFLYYILCHAIYFLHCTYDVPCCLLDYMLMFFCFTYVSK